jgi:hypothetical protein
VVPLDLPECRVLEPDSGGDGTLSVQVMAKTTTITCPHGQRACEKIRDGRMRVKRDIPLRGGCGACGGPQTSRCLREGCQNLDGTRGGLWSPTPNDRSLTSVGGQTGGQPTGRPCE